MSTSLASLDDEKQIRSIVCATVLAASGGHESSVGIYPTRTTAAQPVSKVEQAIAALCVPWAERSFEANLLGRLDVSSQPSADALIRDFVDAMGVTWQRCFESGCLKPRSKTREMGPPLGITRWRVAERLIEMRALPAALTIPIAVDVLGALVEMTDHRLGDYWARATTTYPDVVHRLARIWVFALEIPENKTFRTGFAADQH